MSFAFGLAHLMQMTQTLIGHNHSYYSQWVYFQIETYLSLGKTAKWQVNLWKVAMDAVGLISLYPQNTSSFFANTHNVLILHKCSSVCEFYANERKLRFTAIGRKGQVTWNYRIHYSPRDWHYTTPHCSASGKNAVLT